MKKTILFPAILIITICSFAQTASGDIETYMGDIIDNVPEVLGNDDYMPPTVTDLATWNTVIDFLVVNNLADARTQADILNYQVTEFTDTSILPNQIFYVLEEKELQSNYWGTYVFSKTPKRGNLILQAPHIKFDTNTGKQAVHCFKNNVARAVFISGTHRCNHSDYSSCSGTTKTCSPISEDYRISDMAHNVSTMFQKTTENLFINIPASVFIQLHGFGQEAGDPYVIMSNGTRETPAVDYATLIKEALLVEDNSLTFELAHINTDWVGFIGYTNTQGRLINYSVDECTAPAEGTTGRFIHIEQEKLKLRANAEGWAKMSNALKSVFIEDSDGDGVESGSDIDDYDACVPNEYYSNCGICDIIITRDNFDSGDAGLGNWFDGGNNAFKSEINALGDKSIRLKHGIEVGNIDPDVDPQSSIFTNSLDLSAYSELKVDISFFSPIIDGYESGDDFLLEISIDGGTNYSVFKSWVAGTDFVIGKRYFDSILITGFTFTNNTIIRIRSHANNDLDRVYVDNIVIKGCDSSILNVNEYDLTNDISVFPNPTTGKVSIYGTQINSIEVYNVIGQKISSQKYKLGNNSISIDLKKQDSGIYFLHIISDSGTIIKKVICI